MLGGLHLTNSQLANTVITLKIKGKKKLRARFSEICGYLNNHNYIDLSQDKYYRKVEGNYNIEYHIIYHRVYEDLLEMKGIELVYEHH